MRTSIALCCAQAYGFALGFPVQYTQPDARCLALPCLALLCLVEKGLDLPCPTVCGTVVPHGTHVVLLTRLSIQSVHIPSLTPKTIYGSLLLYFEYILISLPSHQISVQHSTFTPLVCVVLPFILDASLHLSFSISWAYQPGSHGSKGQHAGVKKNVVRIYTLVLRST